MNKRVEKKRTRKIGETAATPAAEVKTNFYVQFQADEYLTDNVMEKIYADWTSQGNVRADVKSLNVYMKPEEKKAYYTINDGVNGVVEL